MFPEVHGMTGGNLAAGRRRWKARGVQDGQKGSRGFPTGEAARTGEPRRIIETGGGPAQIALAVGEVFPVINRTKYLSELSRCQVPGRASDQQSEKCFKTSCMHSKLIIQEEDNIRAPGARTIPWSISAPFLLDGWPDVQAFQQINRMNHPKAAP